jgi:hypothetical protein
LVSAIAPCCLKCYAERTKGEMHTWGESLRISP